VREKLNELFDPNDGIYMGLLKDIDRHKTKIIAMSNSMKPTMEAAARISKNLKVALSTAADMVKASNDLDKALADGNINKIDVQAKLQKVANAVGLTNAKYTIENKMVQISVNLTVTMQAGDVETAIVTNKNSVIRDRLNSIGPLKKNATPDGQHISSSEGPIPFVSDGAR
jgi:hypothetical protein